MVNPADTILPVEQCNMVEPPSYMSRWRPLRWLFLTNRADYDAHGGLSMRDLYESASAYPHIAQPARMWGPLWPEYDDSRTAAANIAARHGDPHYFDVIFYYGDGLDAADLAYFDSTRTALATWQFACPANWRGARGQTCLERLGGPRPNIVGVGNAQDLLYSGP